MWSLVVTSGATEFLVRDRLYLLGLDVFCPYERVKQRVQVRIPRTRANPNPRTRHEMVWRDIVRWPRYLFARAPTNEELSAVASTRDVSYIVRGAEGEPARLPDDVMATMRKGCDASGRVLDRTQLLGFSVGDLLSFVNNSCFAGHTARVVSLSRLNETGSVQVVIDGRFSASVNCEELVAP